MHDVFSRLSTYRIIPVVVLNDLDNTKPLASALCSGGLSCAEITFRTPVAEEAIRVMSYYFPEMIIGAGTVLSTKQAQLAIRAGAAFIVTPGFDPEIVDYCLAQEIPVLPGCMTPSEITNAAKLGISIVKFYPAEAAGGTSMIRALSGPFKTMRFIPTGGIHAGNLEHYLSLPQVLACGGSWMVEKKLIDSGNFKKIESLTKQAISIVESLKKRREFIPHD